MKPRNSSGPVLACPACTVTDDAVVLSDDRYKCKHCGRTVSVERIKR